MITFTANVYSDVIELYADIFETEDKGRTAMPVKFISRRYFTRDKGKPMLTLTKQEAVALANEILGSVG